MLASVALTSGEHLQLTSNQNTMLNAGNNLDAGAVKNLLLATEKALGLFVQTGAMTITVRATW